MKVEILPVVNNVVVETTQNKIIIYTSGVMNGTTGGGTWGTITGTLSAQTDLQAALDLKANTSDIPTNSDFTLAGLGEKSYNSLDDIPSTFNPTSHDNTKHITDLVGEDGVINAMEEKTTIDDADIFVIEDSEGGEPEFRIPTEAEWDTERLSWDTNNTAGAFGSPLKLPMAGFRSFSNGSLDSVGFVGYYWSSSVSGSGVRGLYFLSSNANTNSYGRAYGFSVRLIKDEVYTGDPGDFVSETLTYNGLTYQTVLNPTTNRIWLDRNLGATQVATSSTDEDAYGDLYQWGRDTDGHQIRTSDTTVDLSSSDNPGHGDFILAPNSLWDWRDPQNDNLWQGVSGINLPWGLNSVSKPKKSLFSTIKSTLQTHFNALYQAILVSGTNIKTINTQSILGSGNIEIESGGDVNVIEEVQVDGVALPVTDKTVNVDLSGKIDKDPTSVDADTLTDDSVFQFWKGAIKKITWVNIKAKLNTLYNQFNVLKSKNYEPHGLIDPDTDAEISFDDATRTFTIQPKTTSFDAYSEGELFTKTSPDSIVIDDISGSHFIYYDKTGTLIKTAVFNNDIIYRYCIVAIVYWNSAESKHILLNHEYLHTTKMGGKTHAYLHDTRGFALESGGAIGDLVTDGSGDLDTSIQFSNQRTIAWDEDARCDLIARLSTDNVSVYWKEGLEASPIWFVKEDTSFPIFIESGNTLPSYNQLVGGSWQLTEMGNNNYFLIHVACNNDIDRRFMVFLGQNSYPNLNNVRANAENELDNLILDGMVSPEFRFLATMIVQVNTGYTNTVKARFRSIDADTEYIDWREIAIGRGGVSGAVTRIGDASDVDITEREDDTILVFKTESGKYEHEAKPTGGGDITTNLVASNEIKFDEINQYGSLASARTGDITVDFTGAKLGIVQTMFHDDTELPPEILSNAKFNVIQGYYESDEVNRISFEIIDITAGSEVVLVTIIPVR